MRALLRYLRALLTRAKPDDNDIPLCWATRDDLGQELLKRGKPYLLIVVDGDNYHEVTNMMPQLKVCCLMTGLQSAADELPDKESEADA